MASYRERVQILKRANIAPRIAIGRNNGKLKLDGIVSFSLLAGIHCPGKGPCWELEDGSAGYCFAAVGNYVFPNVMESGQANFNATLLPDFVPNMIAAIAKEKATYIRIHTAGDFYNQTYVNKWSEIAAASPTKRFYAYTKSLAFDFSMMPANVNIIQSTGSRFDHLIDYDKPHSRIFSSEVELIAAGYVNCSHSDLPAAQGAVKVGLVVHGAAAGKFTPEPMPITKRGRQANHYKPTRRHPGIRPDTAFTSAYSRRRSAPGRA